jgi:hypothetical protein
MAHQQRGRGAVGELRGIAGGDEFALGFTHCPSFHTGLSLVTGSSSLVSARLHFVALGDHVFVAGGLAFLVEQLLAGRQRHDFVVEQAGPGRPRCAAGSAANTRPGRRARCRSGWATISAVSSIWM